MPLYYRGLSDNSTLQPGPSDPNSAIGHAYSDGGNPPPRSRSPLVIAVLTCLTAMLILGVILLTMRQRELGRDLQQSLSESKTRGLLEMNLMDKALAVIHDEKVERGNEVSRLDNDLLDVRRTARMQAGELNKLKSGLLQDRADVQTQRMDFKQIEQSLVLMHRDERERKKQLAHLDRVLFLLNDPDAQQVVFGRRAMNQPRGRVYASANEMVIVLASNLPPVPSGKTYEFWLIPKGADPSPAGLFQSDADGTAIHMAAMNNISPAAVAISVEQEAGAPSPTTKPVLIVELPPQFFQ